MKQLVGLNLNGKADFRDLDNLTHLIAGKADITKVQEQISTLKTDLVTQITTLKKDVSTKSKKKEQEQKFESEKILEETKANRDKIQKLAV